MKTIEDLKARAKELGKECADYSKRGVELLESGEREAGSKLMHEAHRTSKRCQVIVGEILRMQKLEA